MHRSMGVVLVLAAMAAGTGCVGRQRFTYARSPEVIAAPLEREALCVRTFRDERGGVNHDLKYLALIPGVPFFVSYRDTPDQTHLDSSHDLYGFRPTEDLAKALAEEVSDWHLFSDCSFVGMGPTPSRFVLTGTIRDLHSSEGYLTYGLSFLSFIPHLLLFPEGTIRGAFEIDLELHDRAEGNRVIWHHRAAEHGTRLTWIYESDEAASLNSIFSDVSKDAFVEAADSLHAFLMARPSAVRE